MDSIRICDIRKPYHRKNSVLRLITSIPSTLEARIYHASMTFESGMARPHSDPTINVCIIAIVSGNFSKLVPIPTLLSISMTPNGDVIHYVVPTSGLDIGCHRGCRNRQNIKPNTSLSSSGGISFRYQVIFNCLCLMLAASSFAVIGDHYYVVPS